MADNGIERRVAMIGRALHPHADMAFVPDALDQRLDETRLADTALAGKQHDLTLARARARAASARPTVQSPALGRRERLLRVRPGSGFALRSRAARATRRAARRFPSRRARRGTRNR